MLHEVERALWLERPDHADLVDVDAESPRLALADAEETQCFHQVEVALARCNDAELRVGDIEDLVIDRVRRRKRQRRVFLLLEPLLDLWARKVGPAIVQPGWWRRVVGRDLELGVGREFDRHRGLDRFGDRLEANPHARVA